MQSKQALRQFIQRLHLLTLKSRRLRLLPHESHQTSDDQSGEQKREQRHNVRGIAYPEGENWRNKKEIQTKISDHRNHNRRDEIAEQRLQDHHDQIKKSGSREIQSQPIADESYESDQANARDRPHARTPKSTINHSLHVGLSLPDFGPC
jgi:hypothetical protein